MKAIAELQFIPAAKANGFARILLGWYDQHARKLPWREDRDPYRVWVSEVMLQQTRVAAVLEYYRRFLKKFPTVHKLAASRESSVLAAWSGLGYYRRARMMHAAAKVIVKDYRGQFPSGSEGLRQLPGIGRYTAAAGIKTSRELSDASEAAILPGIEMTVGPRSTTAVRRAVPITARACRGSTRRPI